MTRDKGFALVRIMFGLVWAIDAAFKWQPEIRLHIVDTLSQAQAGQPALEFSWIQLWVTLASAHPVFFGTMIALLETVLALSLLTGVLSRLALYLGVPFAFLIWSVPQGFGGPYTSGQTDIDSGIIYLLLFTALIHGQAWKEYNLGAKIFKKLQ